jgi:hypothetical protein
VAPARRRPLDEFEGTVEGARDVGAPDCRCGYAGPGPSGKIKQIGGGIGEDSDC